jgi:uncharacterized membrane protein YdbT with pleckstrin-like domain
MAGPRIELMPGEKMLLHAHPHWWFFWKQVLAGLGVVALLVLWVSVSGGLATVAGWATGAAFLVWLGYTGYAFVQWQTTRFAVTDKRVAYQSGFFRRRGVSIPLNRVNNVNFDQTMLDRVLGNGTVTIESAGETGDSVFRNIPHPDRVRQLIFARMEAYEQADSDRDAAALAQALRDAQPVASAAGSTPQDRLRQLDELRAQGMVSDQEYAAKRTEILGDL